MIQSVFLFATFVTGDWETADSHIVISSACEKSLSFAVRNSHFPHMCRAPLCMPHLSFIPPVPYPPLWGTFPSRGRLTIRGKPVITRPSGIAPYILRGEAATTIPNSSFLIPNSSFKQSFRTHSKDSTPHGLTLNPHRFYDFFNFRRSAIHTLYLYYLYMSHYISLSVL